MEPNAVGPAPWGRCACVGESQYSLPGDTLTGCMCVREKPSQAWGRPHPGALGALGPTSMDASAGAGRFCLSSVVWIGTLGSWIHDEGLIQSICSSGPSPELPWASVHTCF